MKFKINSDQTILEQMIEQKIDIPFSCEIGTCGICKVKLIRGQVRMESEDALTDDELNKGYILTCQSYISEDSEIEILNS